jgi:hypothetical protein
MCNLKSDVDSLLEFESGAVESLMDAILMDRVHIELAPCSWRKFLARYCELHEAKYSAPFTVN